MATTKEFETIVRKRRQVTAPKPFKEGDFVRVKIELLKRTRKGENEQQ